MPSLVVEVCRFAFPPPLLQTLFYTGTTLRADDALAKGMVDEIVDAADLESRATAIAERLVSIGTANFALTKRQLRDGSLARADALAREHDVLVLEQWSRPETREHIRAYLAQTIGKRKG